VCALKDGSDSRKETFSRNMYIVYFWRDRIAGSHFQTNTCGTAPKR
jgi:hypothetical protein